jgi:integrase
MKPTKYHKEYEIIIKIGAYTGARENEICQLTKKDILKDENDIYYINLEIDIDDDKTIKTISSFRKVPIHSELEEDLLNYIKSVKTNNLFKIKSNYFSIEFGEFKTKLGFGKKYVFHSFRNTLHDRLKQAKVQLQMVNEIVGHGPEDEEKITNDYTNPYELHILKEAIEKISYKN